MEQLNRKCNMCGSNKSKFLFYGKDLNYKVDEKKFGLERCLQCGLVYLFPQPSLEELSRYYVADYGPYHDHSYVLKYGSFSNFLKKTFHALTLKSKLFSKKIVETKPDTSVKRLLDFGCGNGLYLERMRNLHPNWELIGFDNSEYAYKKTRSKGFKVLSGNLMTAPFPKEHFDIIHLSHVIEHLSDPKAIVLKMHELLKPGGDIIIITPNFDSVAAKIFKTHWFALDSPRHLFLFTPKVLSKLLSDTGFRVTRTSCASGTRVALGSLNYLFPRKDMRMNFILWHFLELILMPGGKLLSKFKKTSIMTVTAKK